MYFRFKCLNTASILQKTNISDYPESKAAAAMAVKN
jgi:hypothetical protein